MDGCLKRIYYDPASEGSFGGVSRFKRVADLQADVPISTSDVKEWLAGQETYTLHKTARVKYPRNRVIVFGINNQWQCDLADLSQYSEYNDDYKFILTCIDVFSKYAWSVCVKNKTGKAVSQAFESIIQEYGIAPAKLQTDNGTEFYNSHFKKVLTKYNIHHFTTNSVMKASVVERFNRTLKTKMWKYLTAINSKRYIDVLDKLMVSYNNTVHSSIKMRPSAVCIENELEVFNNLYGLDFGKKKKLVKFKFRVGDTVRLSKTRSVFAKGYEKNFTIEYFMVSEQLQTTPVTYKLCDCAGEAIQGSFYEQELQKVKIAADHKFKIDRVISRKKVRGKAMVLVRWLGWPPKFDTWVARSDVLDV